MDSTVGGMLKDIVKCEGATPDDDDPKDGGDTADANGDATGEPNGDGTKDADDGSDTDTNEDATGEPNGDGSVDTVWHADVDKPIEVIEYVEEKGGADADSVEPADAADDAYVNNDGRADADDQKGNDDCCDGAKTDCTDNGGLVDVGASQSGDSVEKAGCGGGACEDKATKAVINVDWDTTDK